MECTQKLECTQDIYDSTKKTCPEQIGFLGICGEKYPIKKGPNKIGRDPQTCNIVLQSESISRQHAVINILNTKEFMLMDLDSANKTKLLEKTIQPYIPHPLKNGDTVQFGKIFGVFRLLEEDNDLPMTQALDIPETPVNNRYLSRLNHAPITTIPESPDVSDKDDSFIAPSQPNTHRPFKNESNHFIKPSEKTIAIQPVGSDKIDNIYWNSSKKSTSIGSTFNESSHSLNDSEISVNSARNPSSDINLHEMETQMPFANVNNQSSDSIHTACTQLPNVCNSSPSIHSLDTQMPVPAGDHLPLVCKIEQQTEMQFDLVSANKENDNSIFNAETQLVVLEKDQMTKDLKINTSNSKLPSEHFNSSIQSDKSKDHLKSKNHTPEEDILFDEGDNDAFQDEFESQSLLPDLPCENKEVIDKTDNVEQINDIIVARKRIMRIQSDSSTDCEDIEILPTQKLPTKQVDDDLTDCEEDNEEKSSKENMLSLKNKSPVNFEDMLTQVIEENNPVENKDKNINFEEMPTQIIDDVIIEKHMNNEHEQNNIEDLQTQIIDEDIHNMNRNIPKTNIAENKITEMVSPFKIPMQSPLKVKRKDILRVNTSKMGTNIFPKPKLISADKDERYYEATQEIIDDLCTQVQFSPEIVNVKDKTINNNLFKRSSANMDDDEVVPSSVEEYETREIKLPGLDIDISPKKKSSSDKSQEGSSDNSRHSDYDEKIEKFVSNLSSQQVRDVIGAEVTKLKRQVSDASDPEVTPKKRFKFLETDLPNSQEIKSIVSLHSNTIVTASSSESETENDSEEQFTPILFRQKRKAKKTNNDVKIDLTKKFDADSLPSRIITRQRKPTSKILNSDEKSKKNCDNILKSRILTEEDDIINVDKDIINENISRLKTKNEKFKNNKNITITDEKLNVNDQKTIKKENIKDTQKNQIGSNYNLRENEQDSHSESLTTSSKEIEKDLNLDNNIISSIRSTRNTRNKHKTSEKDKEKTKTEDKKSRRNKNTNKKEEKQETSSEKSKEVRRSKRQKSYKDKKDNDSIIKVKISKPAKKSKPIQHEQSTVYNISSDSGAESPRNLKRSATESYNAPNSKRTRSTVNSSISLRSTPARMLKTQYVLFTAFPCEEVRVKLEKLGAVIVTDVTACTVLLTLHIKRTFKLLCAVGLGRPIVGPSWVQACADNNMIVDPWLYLIKDQAVETRFKFDLERTLTGKRNFLKGYNISSTPNVMPSSPEMKLIVECSGGNWKAEGPQWLCVSCSADKPLWPSLKRRGATIVSTELILAGVLRQKLEIDANKLG